MEVLNKDKSFQDALSNLVELHRYLSTLSNLAQSAGITKLEEDTSEQMLLSEFIKTLFIGDHFFNSFEGIQSFLESDDASFEDFLVIWYKEELQKLHSEVIDLKNQEKEVIKDNSRLRAAIHENKVSVASMERSIHDAWITLRDLVDKERALQAAIVNQRDEKEHLDREVECASNLCHEIERENREYLEGMKRLEVAGHSIRHNEDMSQLELRRKMHVVSQKLERATLS